MMINRLRYGIVLRRELSASGHDELQVAYVLKKDAEAVLRERVPSPRQRQEFRIVRLVQTEIREEDVRG